ncbi:MAG TPA: PA2779 family protein, partial [Spongiibacteraceae bacterium]|nr:PA2779 family protein [Spongiibacteraceae bacterium]
MNIRFLRRTSWTLIFSLFALWLPIGQVHAALIGTDVVASAAQAGINRDRVHSFLQREDVRNLLQTRGLDAAVAQQRIDAMTDAEVQQIAAQLDNLPAGGSDVLGVL